MALDQQDQLQLHRDTPAGPRLAVSSLVPLFDAAAIVGILAVTASRDVLTVAYAILAYVGLRTAGGQRARISPRLGEDVPMLLATTLVPLALVAAVAPTAQAAFGLVKLGPAIAVSVFAARGLGYALIRAARARGLIVEPTLIVGAGVIGREVARTLQEHPEYGLLPVGLLDSVTDDDLPLPLLGRSHDLEPVVREFQIQRVVVAFGLTREAEMVEIIRACDRLPVEVHLVPRFFELGISAEGRYRDDLWGIPLIRLRRSALRTAAWRTKRVFDLVVGSAALVLTSPLFLLAALGVRMSSRGPVFFRQTRIGQDGRLFDLLKFRTLRVNDDSDIKWSVEQDDRVTFVGKILRRTSIDELPQLLNVLRGQMSLIGPRPERPHFVDRFSGEVGRYRDRHRVPVGITGWAQAHGLRGDTSIPERVRFDNYYIEHWSLWRDLVILVRTVWVIITGRH